MQCKNCGGALVARHSLDFPINERGEYTEDYADTPTDVRVVCTLCGARHTYEVIRDTGQPPVIIALEYESDPDPVAIVALAFENGNIVSITSDALVGLVIDDRDRKEVGGFLTRRNEEAWAAVLRLQSLIQKGEHRVSYATHLLPTRGSTAPCGAEVSKDNASPDLNEVTCHSCFITHEKTLMQEEKNDA